MNFEKMIIGKELDDGNRTPFEKMFCSNCGCWSTYIDWYNNDGFCPNCNKGWSVGL